ncbi:MAG TPA: hypothetical protein VGR49_03455 [Actinomycetota bacterium]|nr:hypothetical protein [Actinomycetota bacterium]
MAGGRREIEVGGGAPWLVFIELEADREYLALVTYFLLKSLWRLPRFVRLTLAVRRQLADGPRGLVGYSMTAKPLRRFWTMSAWESEKDLRSFIRTLPHARAVVELPQSMEKFDAQRWRARGKELPPTWEEALRHLPGA